jgi:sigma-54 specific flagellar transcriptional regulator A
LEQNLPSQNLFVGSSGVSEELRSYLSQIGSSSAPVLIRGATGVGKEVVAKALHELSGRSTSGRFVGLNCSAIPSELLESELFGHEKGAFSGAVSAYPGRFRIADGGTLLLDEVGDMPVDLQAKLLRVIQEGVVTPVGGVSEVPVDVRIISATHQDLEGLMHAGSFREDLYYRLNVLPVTVESLAARTEEIPEFINHFCELYGSVEGITSFTTKSIVLLQAYGWPGNVRELESICRRLSAIFPGQCVDLYNVPSQFLPSEIVALMGSEIVSSDSAISRGESLTASIGDPLQQEGGTAMELEALLAFTNQEAPLVVDSDERTLKQQVDGFEKALILKALSDSQSNISGAARLLGVKRTTLIEKMARMEITKNP